MEENMAQSIQRAKFVKKAREERAWTQGQLAEIAGVNLRTIQRLEEHGSASFDTLMGVAQAFEIDVKELNPTLKTSEKAPQKNKVSLLPRLTSGKQLFELIGNTDQYEIKHDESDDIRALGSMIDLLKYTTEDIEKWRNANPVGKLQIELYISRAMKEVDEVQNVKEIGCGFYFFGAKREASRIIKGKASPVSVGTIYISNSWSPKIIRDKNSNMTFPAMLAEFVP